MTKCTLTPDGGGIAIKTPYDAGFVAALKSTIPNGERRWKPESKVWIVAPFHGAAIQNLCMQFFNELPLLPDIATIKPKATQRILDVRYIGATKDRGGDERSAYGWLDGGWNVIFPETVLRGWFDAPMQPNEHQTLYSVLACSRTATDDEIKSAYRRMVRQWHPDVCKEPNAHDQFLAIQHAYEILATRRDRYDAGLALEASLKNAPTRVDPDAWRGYRTPLRCGLIMCEGTESMGLFTVAKIFAWEDVRDNYGRTLVVSWPAGANHFSEVWT